MSFIFLLTGLALTAQAADMNRYGLKSGEIEYRLDGAREGSEHMVFDDFGAREARRSDGSMTVMGMRHQSRSLNILDGEWSYDIDLDSNTGTRMNYRAMMERMTGEEALNARDFSEEMIKAMGGEKTGTDTVLGRGCDVYTSKDLGYSVCVWKGIPLKFSVDMPMVNFTSEAVEIKENARVNPRAFLLPAGVTITDQDPGQMPTKAEMMESRQQMQEARQMMNDPEVQAQMRQAQEMMNSPAYREAMEQMQARQDVLPQQAGQMNGPAVPGEAPSIAAQTAEGVKDAAVEGAQEATKQTVKDEVKKGVGGFLKSMW